MVAPSLSYYDDGSWRHKHLFHQKCGRTGFQLTNTSIVPEPAGSQGWNRYSYVENNPVRYADPSGHILCEGVVGCIEPPAPPPPGQNPAWDRAVSIDEGLSYGAFVDGQTHYNRYVTDPEAYAADYAAQGHSEAASYRMVAAHIYGEYGLGAEGGYVGCIAESRLEGGLAESLYSQGEPLDLLGVGGGSLGASGGGGVAAAIIQWKTSKRFIGGVQIRNRSGNVVAEGIVDLQPTMDRINSGGTHPHRNDGSTFQNREGQLPQQNSGYYTEYVHPTPGMSGPGPQRIVTGAGGEVYYTPDHYKTFTRVD